MDAAIEDTCNDILISASFDPENGKPLDPCSFAHLTSPQPCPEENCLPNKAILFAPQIKAFNEGKESRCQIKERNLIEAVEPIPDNCVYISIDDVGVKRQKEVRKNEGFKTCKTVEHTVIHIESKNQSYLLTAVGMKKAFRLLIAFLLKNNLLQNKHLIFFSDGASNIRKSIEEYFSFCSHAHLLDWYHLEKKLTELLSMALKGTKEVRKAIRLQVGQILWPGNIDDAIEYLKSMDGRNVKNQQRLQEAIEYLERKRSFICCYALRQYCGFRNSSNPSEKANDILVARRQKHNGMSWSGAGSHALAIINAFDRNNELENWLIQNKVSFTLSENEEERFCAA